jgi:hypothetical protein
VGDDEVEDLGHVAALAGGVGHGVALAGAAEDDREVHLLVGGAEVVQQVEHGVDGLVRLAALAVDLVDDEQDLEAAGDRLLGDEPGLRHRALERVDDQQHRVDHVEHALDLAAEVGVAGGVDEVDAHALVAEAGRLARDRDAALTLEVHAVHAALDVPLGPIEGARDREERVDEGGLAVVDVGDDREVSNFCMDSHGRRSYAAWPNSPARTGLQADGGRFGCESSCGGGRAVVLPAGGRRGERSLREFCDGAADSAPGVSAAAWRPRARGGAGGRVRGWADQRGDGGAVPGPG